MQTPGLEKLEEIRNYCGDRQTYGLPEDVVLEHMLKDEALTSAIERASKAHRDLRRTDPDLLKKDERDLCAIVQRDYVNFYEETSVNPYVALAAAGPWLVTTHGAVLHDSAGYGMLGLGHAPKKLLSSLGEPNVMANVMTPSLSQKALADKLRREIGHTRGQCPLSKFICLNSGSEAVTLAARLADINAKRQTDQGAPHEGWKIRQLALVEGFHGRTDRPARISHSTMNKYQENLASFRQVDHLVVVPMNDVPQLHRVFEEADANKVFFEAFFVEPVMGEGMPGLAMSREFYDAARDFTARRGSLLVVDSIQAALRAQGCLSIIDYPGFEDCSPPDIETYSKALNAGQYPLSVVAMNELAANLYVRGVYGNTMTTNPRAAEIGCQVLDSITDEMRRNIRERGTEFVKKLRALSEEFPGAIKEVYGTGLIVCAEMNPSQYKVTGAGGLEEYCRLHGVAMIHGGHNGLRFTPHFKITSAEIDMIIDVIRSGLEAK